MADDIKAAVITDNFEISMIRGQPAVLDRDGIDLVCTHDQSLWRFFTPVASVTVNPDIHLSAGHDNSRVVALFFLLLLLHLPDLFHHFGHFLFHGLGKHLHGFCQIVGG
jgi:hypothetical protein